MKEHLKNAWHFLLLVQLLPPPCKIVENPMIKEMSTDKLYIEYLSALKERIRNAQLRAAKAVNNEAIVLYWHIGRDIIEKQQQTKWGSGFIAHLSHDLLTEFPGMGSFSVRNLRFMRQFAENYPNVEIVKQLASLPKEIQSGLPTIEQLENELTEDEEK